jgi:V-type H+-transporting ATPase subunit d
MATLVEGYHGSIADFNIQHGFTEALVRGMRSSFLPDSDYHHLTQCESLEDVKLNLTESDYGSVVADITTLTPSNLQSVAVQKVSVPGSVHCSPTLECTIPL